MSAREESLCVLGDTEVTLCNVLCNISRKEDAMKYYGALFVPVKEGGYVIFFPDVPEVKSQGKDIGECMKMAKDALFLVLMDYARARMELPEPSCVEKLEQEMADFLREEKASVDGKRKPLIQFFPVSDTDISPVRVNICMLKAELEEIDAKAARAGKSRSAFLVAAALASRLGEA